MAAIHASTAGSLLMVHGSVFMNYDAQGSARDDSQFDSINWLMLMARHALGPGEVKARIMSSLEPLPVGGAGYGTRTPLGGVIFLHLRPEDMPHDYVGDAAGRRRLAHPALTVA